MNSEDSLPFYNNNGHRVYKEIQYDVMLKNVVDGDAV